MRWHYGLHMLFRTCLTQSAKIAVFGVPLFGSLLEGLLINHYGSSVAKVSHAALLHCALYNTLCVYTRIIHTYTSKTGKGCVELGSKGNPRGTGSSIRYLHYKCCSTIIFWCVHSENVLHC